MSCVLYTQRSSLSVFLIESQMYKNSNVYQVEYTHYAHLIFWQEIKLCLMLKAFSDAQVLYISWHQSGISNNSCDICQIIKSYACLLHAKYDVVILKSTHCTQIKEAIYFKDRHTSPPCYQPTTQDWEGCGGADPDCFVCTRTYTHRDTHAFTHAHRKHKNMDFDWA